MVMTIALFGVLLVAVAWWPRSGWWTAVVLLLSGGFFTWTASTADVGDADHCIAYAGHVQLFLRYLLPRYAYNLVLWLAGSVAGDLSPGAFLRLSRGVVAGTNIAFGVGMVALARVLGGRLAADDVGRVLFQVGLLGSIGIAQMAAGHVEVYPAFVLAGLGVVVAGEQALGDGTRLPLLWGAWGLSVACHLMGVLLLPGVLFVSYRRGTRELLLRSGGLVVAIGGVLLLLTTILHGPDGVANALELFWVEGVTAERRWSPFAAMIDLTFWRERLFLTFLVAMAAGPCLLVAAMLPWRPRCPALVAFLGLLAGGLFVGLLPFRLELGMERDWDIYAGLAVPLGALTGLLLAEFATMDDDRAPAIAFFIAVGQLLVTGGALHQHATTNDLALPAWAASAEAATAQAASPVELTLRRPEGRLTINDIIAISARLDVQEAVDNVLPWIILQDATGAMLFQSGGVWVPSPMPFVPYAFLDPWEEYAVDVLAWDPAERRAANDHLPDFLDEGLYRLTVLVTTQTLPGRTVCLAREEVALFLQR